MAHFKVATFLLHISSLPRHSVRTCSLFQAKRVLYFSSIMKRSLDYSTSESGAPNSLDYRMYFRKYNYFRSCVVECKSRAAFPSGQIWWMNSSWSKKICYICRLFALCKLNVWLTDKKFDVEIWWIRFTVLKERWSNCIAYRLAYPGSCGIMLHLLSSRAVNCCRLASLNVKKGQRIIPSMLDEQQ